MRSLALGVMVVVALQPCAVTTARATVAARPAAPTVTVVGRAFGVYLDFEAVAGEGAEAALIAALAAVRESEAASDLRSGPLAELNRGAGGGPRKTPEPLLATLSRALAFCRWSEGTLGPLGGPLNELWGLRSPRPGLPAATALEEARAAAACDRLRVDAAQATATLAAGSRVDLWGFELGAALDRAVALLAARGVRDASLLLGNVQRAVGAGPEGRGWALRIDVPSSVSSFTGGLRLRDQSLAVASRDDGELRAGGERYAPYLDQRSGRPATGVVATVAISELALDAQGLASTLFVTGSRRGSLLLGQLQPQPSVLWVLGDGKGEPLVSDYRWGGRLRRGGR